MNYFLIVIRIHFSLNHRKLNLASTAYRTRSSDSWNFKYYRYDVRGRVIKLWNIISGFDTLITEYYYNSQDQVINFSAADGVPKSLPLIFEIKFILCANFLVTNSRTFYEEDHLKSYPIYFIRTNYKCKIKLLPRPELLLLVTKNLHIVCRIFLSASANFLEHQQRREPQITLIRLISLI